jgi:hypothetical protein
MQFDELRFICQQAALDVVQKRGRPTPPTLVLPGPDSTRLVSITDFPDGDEERHAVIAEIALQDVTGTQTPCWGFIAEADVHDTDMLVVVYGARRHAPEITAAVFAGDTTEEFMAPERLDPTALPFLHPLQHAVDALSGTGDVFATFDPKRGPAATHQHPPSGPTGANLPLI